MGGDPGLCDGFALDQKKTADLSTPLRSGRDDKFVERSKPIDRFCSLSESI
jgi:hypothetical protein